MKYKMTAGSMRQGSRTEVACSHGKKAAAMMENAKKETRIELMAAAAPTSWGVCSGVSA